MRADWRRGGAIALSIGLVLVGPFSRSLGGASAMTEPPHLSLSSGCEAVDDHGEWQPVFVGPDARAELHARCADSSIDAYLAVWDVQSQGREAVSEQNLVIPHAWRFATESASTTTSAGLPVMEHAFAPGEADVRVIWTWYAVGASPATGDFHAKALEARNAALLRTEPVAMFAVSARAASEDAARKLLATETDRLWHHYLDSMK